MKTSASKLLIKPDTAVWVSDQDRAGILQPLPDGASLTDDPTDADTAVLFAALEKGLRSLLDQHGNALTRPAYLWIAYPKGGRADINRDSLWPVVAERIGMRPVTQVALDETWSALRFRPLKPGEEFRPGR